jgi:hypothetical protein
MPTLMHSVAKDRNDKPAVLQIVGDNPISGSSDRQLENDMGVHIPSVESSASNHVAFGRSSTLLDAGEIRFVNLLVRRPCLVVLGTVVMLVVCLMGLGSVVASEGADIFSADGGDDLADPRTRRRDALALARDFGGKKEEKAVEAPTQTQAGQSLLLVYVAKDGENVFSEAAIRRMRQIEDKITKDPDFPKFCLRAEKSGNRSTCTAPLSATRLFYAAGLNVAEVLKQVDALDGAADGQLTVFKMKNLTMILQELQRGVAKNGQRGWVPLAECNSNQFHGQSYISDC